MATQEQIDQARGLIERVEKHENTFGLTCYLGSDEILALVAVAKQALPVEPDAASPDITPEWLLEVGGRRINDTAIAIGTESGPNLVVHHHTEPPDYYFHDTNTCGFYIGSLNLTRDRFRALAFGLGITLKGDGK